MKTDPRAGVGHGLTTSAILQAISRNGNGELWSIDLPPLVERRLAIETGDSMHTSRITSFELNCVWPALAYSGAALVDDNSETVPSASCRGPIPSQIVAM